MKITIVTPAAAGSRHGNRNTAARWARLLRELGHRVDIQVSWNGAAPDLLIALHARRSHESIDRFAGDFPARPLVVVLTGTDLYRDIRTQRRCATIARMRDTTGSPSGNGCARARSAAARQDPGSSISRRKRLRRRRP